jgi:hypothetical protein
MLLLNHADIAAMYAGAIVCRACSLLYHTHPHELGWFCEACCSCCEYVRAEGTYDHPPWDEECVTEQLQVPHDPQFQLHGELDWEEFNMCLRQLPNRKAPGDNLVPAELWKHASEWAVTSSLTPVTRC